MPGERGLNGDFRGERIANFADHHHIGILTKNCAQRRGEGDADFFVHRHLRHAAQFVFDRIFDREDFLAPRAHEIDCRVECRRFSGARGAGRENDAETILFWHRGLSLSDIALGHAILKKAAGMGAGHRLRYA